MPIEDLFEKESDSSEFHPPQTFDAGQNRERTKLRHVLVIEDSTPNFEILQFYLAQSSTAEFVIKRAGRLSDGIMSLANDRFHLVLLDLMLPDSSGLDTFLKLQSLAPHIPIIVITGVVDESVALQAVSAGAADFLLKENLDADSLLRSIDYARSRHRIQKEVSRSLKLAQASEEKLAAIINSTEDAVTSVNLDGNIVSWNHGAEKIYGYTAKEVLGKHASMLAPPEQQDQFDEVLPSLKRSESIRIETVRIRKDGQQIDVSLSASPIRDAQGEIVGIVGIIRDITERKRAEADRIKRVEAEREINIARAVQEGLFPSSPPSLPGFDIAGAVYPAADVSGDYFDFIPMRNDSVGVVVADVCGHGLGPAMTMVQTQAYLRALAETNKEPGQILTGVNKLLGLNEHGRFVSLFLGCLEPRTRTFTFASAGHSGYLLNRTGDVTILAATGTVLGISEDERFACDPPIKLKPGDLIFLPTDGIQESHLPDQELFGVARMLEVVRANRDKSAIEIIRAAYQAAQDWDQGRPLDDDITAVVIKMT